MKLRRCVVFILLTCYSVLWVATSSSTTVKTPPGCYSALAFSSEVSSASERSGDIHSRSLSPWTWRWSTVKNRIPTTLWEAECNSSFCSSLSPSWTDGQDLNSVPVYQDVLILTRQDGKRCYTASYQSVTVGCTCIKAKSSDN